MIHNWDESSITATSCMWVIEAPFGCTVQVNFTAIALLDIPMPDQAVCEMAVTGTHLTIYGI